MCRTQHRRRIEPQAEDSVHLFDDRASRRDWPTLGFKFSGFVAWWLWRTIYLAKLPRLEKKVRVALDWTLDVLFAKDLVQFGTHRAPSISRRETLSLMRDEPTKETGTISATASL